MARVVAKRELACKKNRVVKREDTKHRNKLELRGKYISKNVRKKKATVDRVMEKKN